MVDRYLQVQADPKAQMVAPWGANRAIALVVTAQGADEALVLVITLLGAGGAAEVPAIAASTGYLVQRMTVGVGRDRGVLSQRDSL